MTTTRNEQSDGVDGGARLCGVALLAFMASSLIGCAVQEPARSVASGGSAQAERRVDAVRAPQECGSRAAFPTRHAVSWVEDARQKLCCSPRAEGGHWLFIAPEACAARYAPWLRLPDVIEPSRAATGEQPNAAVCAPGVEATVRVPASELDSGSLLRVESCLAESCAAAMLGLDNLSPDDQLLFALEGEPASGASLVWRGGALRLSVRVVQALEQIVQGERYRLTLLVDGKPLRAIDTKLAYSTPEPGGCPLARVMP